MKQAGPGDERLREALRTQTERGKSGKWAKADLKMPSSSSSAPRFSVVAALGTGCPWDYQ